MSEGQKNALKREEIIPLSQEIPKGDNADVDLEETVTWREIEKTVSYCQVGEVVHRQKAKKAVPKQRVRQINLPSDDKRLVVQDEDCEQSKKDRELYQLAEGEILAERYVISDVLGFGGFGITYKAWDQKLEMQVAIKEYFPAHLADRVPGSRMVEVFSKKKKDEYEKGLLRFLEEAQNIAQFSKEKNIVNVYNYFRENRTAYLVMEFLDGCSLKEYIMSHGKRLPYTQVIDITENVLDALRKLHQKGIIHRDISPDNIFMCRDGVVKLIDFGAARFAGESDEVKTMSVILKPGFAPPEQYRAKGKQGAWTDIYALGATMYRAVTGVIPEESVNRSVKDTLKDARDYVPEIPKYYNAILMKCLALQPQIRFRSVDELEHMLKKKKRVLSVRGEIAWRRLVRVALVSVFLALITLAGMREYRYIQELRNKASLETCTITVMVPRADGEDVGSAKERFREAISEFEQTYPFVQIEVTEETKEGYAKRLEQLAKEDKLPVVFETDALEGNNISLLAKLSDTYEMLRSSDYVGNQLPDVTSGEQLQLATSFDTIICYRNTLLIEGEKKPFAPQNDLQLFLEGKSAVYIGTLNDYLKIQESLAGIYAIDFPAENGIVIDYSHAWGVRKGTDTKLQNAGIRLVYYLMGERAQDVLYIQNEGGFPVHKDALETYLTVNPEFRELEKLLNGDKIVTEITEEMLENIYQREIAKIAGGL